MRGPRLRDLWWFAPLLAGAVVIVRASHVAQAVAAQSRPAAAPNSAPPSTRDPAQRVTPVRIADQSCEQCHAAIFRRYVTTPMANGSGLAQDHFVPGTLHHARSGMDYSIALAEDTPALRYSRPGDSAITGTRRLQYFLGSGNLGSTYLYRQDGYLLESPVAFYSHLHTYDMAPGLTEVTHMPAALPMTRGCMRCHMSDVQAPDPGTRDHFAALPFLHGGITCEACHGDSTAHVASGGHAAIVNPARLDPAARDSVCIACHLEGDTSVERRGRSIYDYRPGAHIADDITHFVLARDSTGRSVSETEELEVSRCKRSSGDRMSCMSCHDPHGDPSPVDRVAFYRAKCLQCHAEPAFVRTHFPATPDCTGCHMPKSGTADTPHVAWTDHRIRRRPAEEIGGALQLNTLDGTRAPLVPVFAGAAVAPRDLGLASYKMLAKGHPELAADAWRLLQQSNAADPADTPVLLALAAMNQQQGNVARAEAMFAEALRREPESFEAANDLALLLARSGRMPEARALWEKTFARNQDIDALGMNTAVAQCATGDRERAIATLGRVLAFSPDLAPARQRLTAMRSGAQACSPPK